MVGRWLTGDGASRVWVSLDEVSPAALHVIVISEDISFCSHRGVDVEALRRALDANRARGTRYGASTITNQVARNVFLWPHRDPVRKALEFTLTGPIELTWSKRRILEMYVNIAEFGRGIFGIEQAARHYYGVSARELSTEQAARLAVVLPDPRRRDPRQLTPGTEAAARRLEFLAARLPRNSVVGCAA
jgi:monofunctional glycosyltransferase